MSKITIVPKGTSFMTKKEVALNLVRSSPSGFPSGRKSARVRSLDMVALAIVSSEDPEILEKILGKTELIFRTET